MRISKGWKVVGFYRDELGRIRPRTVRSIVIELPPTVLGKSKKSSRKAHKKFKQTTLDNFSEGART